MVRTIGYCQLCGSRKQLGLFHILPIGRYPRLQLHRDNLLLTCWFGCHYPFHHDFYKARDIIVPRIKEVLGEDYEEELKELNNTQPKLNMTRLEEIHEELKELYK